MQFVGTFWALVPPIIAITLALGFFGCMVQSNSIGSTMQTAFGIPSWIVGLVLVAICGFIFIGGIRTGSNTISGLPAGTLCLGTPDGSVYVSITKSGVDIKGNVKITGDLTTTGGTVNLN